MLILSFIFVIGCGLFEWRRTFKVRLSFVYKCIAVGDPNTKRGGSVPLTGLPGHMCVPVPSQDINSQRSLSCCLFHIE